MKYVQNEFLLYDFDGGGGGLAQQIIRPLTLAQCYDYATGVPPGTLSSNNTAAQMNFVALNGGLFEFVAFVSIKSGFLGDYKTNVQGGNSPFYQVVHALGNSLTGLTPVPYPLVALDSFTFAPQDAQAGQQGKSDEFCYVLLGRYNNHLTGNIDGIFYFNTTTQTVSCMTHADAGVWSKIGDSFYFCDLFPGNLGLYKFSVAAGIGTPTAGFNNAIFGPVGPLTLAGDRKYSGIRATNNFVWLFDSNQGLGNAVYKCDLSGNLITAFNLGLSAFVCQMDVQNDTRVWIWTEINSNAFTLYYMDIGDGIVHPFNGAAPNFTIPPNAGCAYGDSGDLYNQLIYNNGSWFTGHLSSFFGFERRTARISTL